MDQLHQRLRSAREKAGLAQAQLAELVQVVPSAVSHWENGRRKPGRDLLAKIAQATLTDPAALLAIETAVPRIRRRLRTVEAPASEGELTEAERELLSFWRALSERQRENFLKLIRVSFYVRRKVEGNSQSD